MFWRRRQKVIKFTASLMPEEPLFIIGDVHGQFDLLERLLDKTPNGAQVIFVGDLIDRGEESAQVIRLVKSLCDEGAICLMGNHERMMLDFIERPKEFGSRWLRYGGLQTLQSYDVRGVAERASEEALLTARDNLEAALSESVIDWLRNLPLHWFSGNVHVVHAAADPTVAMDKQVSDTLLWGSPAFTKQNRGDDQWVVHGHTIVDHATVIDGRISIDTGAYATGILTGLYVQAESHQFVST